MSRGLSQFVSAALLVLVGIVAISLVLSIINPTLNKARDVAIVNEAVRNLQLIDQTIKEVASEGVGSKRTIKLNLKEGIYRIDPNADSVNFTYSPRSSVPLGIHGSIGNINVSQSGNQVKISLEYSNVDLKGSVSFSKGSNDLVITYNETNSKPIIYIEVE